LAKSIAYFKAFSAKGEPSTPTRIFENKTVAL